MREIGVPIAGLGGVVAVAEADAPLGGAIARKASLRHVLLHALLHAVVAPLLLFTSSLAPYLVCACTFRSNSRRREKLGGRTPRLSSRLLLDLRLSLLGLLL